MRSPRLISISLLLACCLVPFVARSECVDYGEYLHWVGSFDANASSTAISGSAAVVPFSSLSATGVYFISVDPMNPGGPEILSSVDLGGNSWGMGVAASGGHVYVGQWYGFCQGGYIQVIDATDLRHPALRGSIDVPGDVYSVTASGSYCYVGEDCLFRGLQVIDASNPYQPSIAGSVEVPGGVEGIAISGDYAYLTVADQVHYPYPSWFDVVDISKPDAPSIVAELDLSSAHGSVVIAGHYAYVGALDIIDIADPRHPVLAGGITTAFGHKCIADGRLFIGAQIYGLSNPLVPELLGSVAGLNVGCTAVLGPNICLAADNFHVYGLGNSRNPSVVGSVVTPGQPRDVAVSGDYAYVADDTAGLLAVDVSQPASPQITGSASLPSPAVRVRVRGPLAYVVMERGLAVVDLIDPRNPRVIGTVETPHGLRSIAVTGDHAYVTGDDGTAGFLSVIDVGNPSAPEVVRTLDTEGLAFGIAVSGEYAYVAVRTPWPFTYHVRVVRITFPEFPQIVASVEGVFGTAIAISGSHAFLNSWALEVVDITDPLNPRLVATVDSPPGGSVFPGISIAGNYAYTSNDGSYDVVDISDPETPRVLGGAAGSGAGIAVSGAFVYSACYGAAGIHELRIMPAQCDPSSASTEGTSFCCGPRLEAFPNPASCEVALRLSIPGAGWTRVSIHDVGGRLLRNLYEGFAAAGPQDLLWDGRDGAGRAAAPGVYLARVTAGGRSRSARVVIVK